MSSELEFVNNLWWVGTEYRYRVIVPARQATWAGGIDSLESISGLLKSSNIRALIFQMEKKEIWMREIMRMHPLQEQESSEKEPQISIFS
jgi:hypothetical protein